MTTVEKVNGTSLTAEPRFDPVALAEAEAIRKRADAEAEARRIEAEGKAKAEQIKAREEAEKQRIINERAAMKLAREKADHALRLAETDRKRRETERATREAEEKAATEEQVAADEQAKRERSASSWRKAALGFAIVCAIVALPVQMSAFWSPSAPWLIVAPLVLEGGAWVVLKGAAAAVDDHRPHWHYRLIAWLLAFLAAGINLSHGLIAFDPATAAGTAFASLAGPGVWDLHEHGRIRVRDGKLTRRERKAKRLEEKRATAEKAASEARQRAEKEAADKAAAEAAEELDRIRREEFPEVHRHARRLAAAWGETAITPAAWRQAHIDIEGTEPGESVDIIRSRNMAARRVQAARSEGPGSTPSKVTSTQRASQMPGAKKPRVYSPPARRGVRTKGDTAPYVAAARKQAAIAAKTARTDKHI